MVTCDVTASKKTEDKDSSEELILIVLVDMGDMGDTAW